MLLLYSHLCELNLKSLLPKIIATKPNAVQRVTFLHDGVQPNQGVTGYQMKTIMV